MCEYEKLKQPKIEWVASIFGPYVWHTLAWLVHELHMLITYHDTSKHSYVSTKYEILWFHKIYTTRYTNYVIGSIWQICTFLRKPVLISHSLVPPPPPNRTTSSSSSHVNNMTVINQGDHFHHILFHGHVLGIKFSWDDHFYSHILFLSPSLSFCLLVDLLSVVLIICITLSRHRQEPQNTKYPTQPTQLRQLLPNCIYFKWVKRQ